MKPITLRNLPPEIAKLVRSRAKADNSSLNKTVIKLLEECAAGSRKAGGDKLCHDLDHLAGRWTRAEAEAFDATPTSERQIDPELWK